MWVKSQDRTRLQNFNGFNLETYETGASINGWVNDWYVQIGRYASKRRALEVLRSINYHLGIIEHNKMYLCDTKEQYALPGDVIYDMPAE